MNNKMPRTPFSTPLSGSARETEIRIRNIMSGPKKRPPLPFLILVFAVCIFCGNLVSCQVAEADVPAASDTSASVSELPDASTPEEPAWTLAELKNSIVPDCLVDEPYAGFTWEKIDRLEGLPVDELPREAVEVFHAVRQDYWRDMLLPVAYDQGTDLTVYFVVDPDSMPNVEPLVSPLLWGELDRWGVLLRLGNHLGYFDLDWEINAKFASAPLLCVDDFDGDSRPEAALALSVGEGTGCYVQSLYIIELDYGAMTYSTPDYSDIPLEIAVSPGGDTARLSSGEREWKVDLTQLVEPFKGAVEVGNQVRFLIEDGQLVCDLYLDFSCLTLEYLASAHFPVVYEDGGYKLGPAVWMGDIL